MNTRFFCQKPKRMLGKFMFFQCIMPLLSEILGRLKHMEAEQLNVIANRLADLTSRQLALRGYL